MYVICVASQKGGTGKSTIALHLAVAGVLAGHSVVVIDIDPQCSAAEWGDSRAAEAPVVISAQAKRIAAVLTTARDKAAGLAIIDTAPHSGSETLIATREADLVVIPCRTSVLDLRAISATIDLARQAQKKSIVVLNAVPPRGGLVDEAREAIAAYALPVAPVSLGQRAAFQHAITSGLTAMEYEPLGKASMEAHELYKWVITQVE